MEDSKKLPLVEKNEEPHGSSFQLTLLMLFFLFAVGYAERMVYFVNPVRGLILHAYILVGLILIVSAYWDRSLYRYLLVLSIVPLMRMVGLAIPLPYFPVAFWYILVILTLFVAVLLYAQRLALTSVDLGVRLGKWPVQLLVGLSGVLIGAGQYFLVGDALSTDSIRQFPNIVAGVALLLGYGFVEELIFRGLLQQILERILGNTMTWVYIAAVYAVLTLGSYSVGYMGVAFGASLFFSWVVWRTESILGVSLAHGLASVTFFLILPGLNP